MAKKFYCFVMLCLYVLGVLGGIGYAIYGGAWPVAIGIAATAYLAFPKAKELFEYLKP